jgi:hypothetical protein
MKKSKNALVDQAAHPASIDTETATETGTNIAIKPTPTEWDKAWQGYCKYATGLHRRPDDLADFEADLQGGRRPDVTEPAMMTAALALVSGMADAGVRRWDFLPPPSGDDLRDPAAWAGQRLVERRAEQDAAERVRNQQRKLARALGQTLPAGNGTGRPVYRQRLGRPLAEVGDALNRVIAEHQSKHGEFKRQWLDPNSPRFIAGVTNKEVIMMASEISGRQEERPYDQNWTIVTNWLRNRQAQQTPDQAE